MLRNFVDWGGAQFVVNDRIVHFSSDKMWWTKSVTDAIVLFVFFYGKKKFDFGSNETVLGRAKHDTQ